MLIFFFSLSHPSQPARTPSGKGNMSSVFDDVCRPQLKKRKRRDEENERPEEARKAKNKQPARAVQYYEQTRDPGAVRQRRSWVYTCAARRNQAPPTNPGVPFGVAMAMGCFLSLSLPLWFVEVSR